MVKIIATAVVTFFACATASATLFTPGDLIVSAYGSSGTSTAQGAPTAISLYEYSTSGGSPVLTDTLPTVNGVGGAANLGVVGQYGSSSEGNIQLSSDGRYLTFAGYSASASAAGIQASTNSDNGTSFALGTAFSHSTVSLAQSSDANVPRLALLVDADGNVNSSTELNDVYSTNNPRSVYSATGSTFYISGQGDGNNADQGIFYGPTGLNTVTSPGSPPTGIYNAHDTRSVIGYNGNLYYSADNSSGSVTGVWKYTGMPTSAASATQIIPGNNGLSGSKEVFYSPESFYFANPNTLYIADTGVPKAGSLGDGGIQKWTFNGSTWALAYTLTPTTSGWILPGNPGNASSGQTGFEAITGQIIGTGPTATVNLFAVSYTLGDDNPDGLYAITDTLSATSGATENFTELESTAGNGGLTFKGVSFAPAVPEPASLMILGMGSLMIFARRKTR